MNAIRITHQEELHSLFYSSQYIIRDIQIADTLVVSKRTVETHIGNILSKLGYNARTQIAVWDVEKGPPKKND